MDYSEKKVQQDQNIWIIDAKFFENNEIMVTLHNNFEYFLGNW